MFDPITYDIDKDFTVGNRRVRIQKRSKDNAMGRFGGGWNWHVGAQGSGRGTFIIFLFVVSIRIEKVTRR